MMDGEGGNVIKVTRLGFYWATAGIGVGHMKWVNVICVEGNNRGAIMDQSILIRSYVSSEWRNV
jgi:hypothetical protein